LFCVVGVVLQTILDVYNWTTIQKHPELCKIFKEPPVYCTFQEVDNIFSLAVGIAVYDDFFSCMCAAEFMCALDVFARHTSSRITFLTLTIVGRSRGDVSSHQDIFQTFRFPESQDGWLFEDHPMHTIQQHTYRRRIHHILQCQLQDGKYYLPPGMCNLWPSLHRRN
jgi:hypothetical protein